MDNMFEDRDTSCKLKRVHCLMWFLTPFNKYKWKYTSRIIKLSECLRLKYFARFAIIFIYTASPHDLSPFKKLVSPSGENIRKIRQKEWYFFKGDLFATNLTQSFVNILNFKTISCVYGTQVTQVNSELNRFETISICFFDKLFPIGQFNETPLMKAARNGN